uniref:Uncharacterized protein n=1 Tax=Pyxicephalus adspersus TaxID=30357 RepID=A0AAV3A4V7_PYXAD|nr:TPA: hypothetical protein GDO54_016774 [Pyxicephalus adspersus]
MNSHSSFWFVAASPDFIQIFNCLTVNRSFIIALTHFDKSPSFFLLCVPLGKFSVTSCTKILMVIKGNLQTYGDSFFGGTTLVSLSLYFGKHLL